MKVIIVSVLLVSAIFGMPAEDDGKYHPEPTTASSVTLPVVTTIRPITPWSNPAWTTNRWNEPRWPAADPRWSTAADPRWSAVNPRVNTWNTYPRSQWNNTNDWNKSWTNYPWGQPTTAFDVHGRPDYRTIRLDEKADPRGYHYAYETVAGIVAEETGTFEHVGLRHEGQRIVGSVVITNRDGVIYRINYQADTKEPYVPRGSRVAERVPPTITRLLTLLESHK